MVDLSRNSFRRRGLGMEMSDGGELDYSVPPEIEAGAIRQLNDNGALEQKMTELGWQVELQDGVDGKIFKSRYVMRKPILGFNDRYEARNLVATGMFDHGEHIADGWKVRHEESDEYEDKPGSLHVMHKWIMIEFEGYPTEETHDILMRIGPAFDNRSIRKRYLGWLAQNRQRRAR